MSAGLQMFDWDGSTKPRQRGAAGQAGALGGLSTRSPAWQPCGTQQERAVGCAAWPPAHGGPGMKGGGIPTVPAAQSAALGSNSACNGPESSITDEAGVLLLVR